MVLASSTKLLIQNSHPFGLREIPRQLAWLDRLCIETKTQDSSTPAEIKYKHKYKLG
jgi:hypothetical protein